MSLITVLTACLAVSIANSPTISTESPTIPRLTNSPLTNTDITCQPIATTTDYLPAYYHYIHPAHPFLPPFSTLLTLLSLRPLPHLLAAITYITSFHIQPSHTPLLLAEAVHQISSPLCPHDGYAVQANLLIAIGLDGSGELKRALAFFSQAVDVALEIGMQHEWFAERNGGGNSVMEESWRRTWWECVVLDGMVAGVHQASSVRLDGVGEGVGLPCEEGNYISGNIPSPRSLEEFNDEDFSEDDTIFSSFAYRIAAISNLARILAIPKPIFPDDPLIAKTDAYLVNWSLHLPSTKRIVVDDGRVDEMIFQAHMITYASTLLLHKPHAHLDTAPTQTITSCAPHQPTTGRPTYNIHAAKVVQAASDIASLIALPVPLTLHTHFFTCVVTLGAIVDLSRWAGLEGTGRNEEIKQQIRLYTGALKTIAAVWPSARKAQGQVKGAAQEIFASRKLAVREQEFWGGLLDEEMLGLVDGDGEFGVGLLESDGKGWNSENLAGSG
ncbi:hypothetical protein VF21_05624 [Pseudogymnoascus sp. 05NY08]|nr:hypothetical protein VF21_05624 [Pseudogymnoascus sp. 05NY08]